MWWAIPLTYLSIGSVAYQLPYHGTVPKRLVLELADEEHARWLREAEHHRIPLPGWVKRVVRFTLEARTTEATIAGRPKRLVSAVMSCQECGVGLGGSAPTARLRYCSDYCRVKAWRRRRRQALLQK
jgi:hypothetical protein